jgi:PAS domain S-box-containing protein
MTEAAIRVLVIEDDPGYGRLVKEMLGAAGGPLFQVEHARHLAEGCALLSLSEIDVILLDLGLPDSAGLDTFDRVHKEAPGIPIVVLSHVDDEAVAMDAARHGAQDYLVKGYMDAHALGRAVRYAVERARADAALSESQRTLSTLMGNLPGMAYRCSNTPKWTMEFVSSGCYELTGHHPEELISDRSVSYGDLVHPDDRDVGSEYIQAALGENRPFKLTYRIRTASGEERWVWEQGVGVRDSSGEVVAVEGFIIDTTERRQAERAHRLLATAVDQGAEAIAITDTNGVIRYVNPSFERITGYSRDEVIGKSPDILRSGKHEDSFYDGMWATIKSGDVWSGRFINKRKDGTLYRHDATIWLDVTCLAKSSSRSSSGSRRKWKRSASWPVVSLTTSTTCSPLFSVTARC